MSVNIAFNCWLCFVTDLYLLDVFIWKYFGWGQWFAYHM